MTVSNDAFLAALIASDWALAERFLAEGVDREQVVLGKTPLLLMASRGASEACAWLLDHGAAADARTPEGHSALHLALDIEHLRQGPATIDALLDHGAAIDLPDNLGVRPLVKALGLRRGDHAAARLIAMGADINATTHLGTTPLLAAATSGKKEFVVSLLTAGADPGAMTADGRGFVYAVIEGDEPEMLQDVLPLIPRSAVNQPNRSGTTPIGLAAYHGSVPAITALLDAGADPNTTSKNRFANGVTPLMMLALQDEKGDAVRKALEKGADVSMRTTNGANAASFAARQGNWAALEILAQAGADMAALDRMGLSPYLSIIGTAGSEEARARAAQKAAKAKKPADGEAAPSSLPPEDIIRTLHAAGCPFEPVRVPGPLDDEESKPYPSPLTLACSLRAWDLARLMVQLGAKPDAQGPDGTTPLHQLARVTLTQAEYTVMTAMRQRAVQNVQSREEAAKATKNVEAKTDEMLDAKTEQQAAMLKVLLDAGASPDAVDDKGFTALAFTVRGSGNSDAPADRRALLSTTLMEAGADPWAAGPDGESAIVVALATGQVKMFHALWALQKNNEQAVGLVHRAVASSSDSYAERERFLDLLQSMGRGPWLDHADEDGNTPLILAAATGQTDVVVALLALGADPNAVNHAGETAVMHAVEQHRGDIVAHLRLAGADMAAVRPDGSSVADLVARLHDDYVERGFKGELDAEIKGRVLSDAFQAARAEGEALWSHLAPAPRRPRP